MTPIQLVLAVVSAGASPGTAAGPSFSEQARLTWVVPPMTAGAPADDPQPLPVQQTPAPFGSKGSWRWYLQGGYAFEVTSTENQFAIFGGGLSYFVIDNLSLQGEVNGLYFSQTGGNALGLNFTVLARWHFLARDRWSLYADLGIGVLGTTAQVPGPTAAEPRGGGYFNFTPQAGLGFSCEIAVDTRLLVGGRWYHISNARTRQSNPPRDSLMFYVGVSFPL